MWRRRAPSGAGCGVHDAVVLATEERWRLAHAVVEAGAREMYGEVSSNFWWRDRASARESFNMLVIMMRRDGVMRGERGWSCAHSHIHTSVESGRCAA